MVRIVQKPLSTEHCKDFFSSNHSWTFRRVIFPEIKKDDNRLDPSKLHEHQIEQVKLDEPSSLRCYLMDGKPSFERVKKKRMHFVRHRSPGEMIEDCAEINPKDFSHLRCTTIYYSDRKHFESLVKSLKKVNKYWNASNEMYAVFLLNCKSSFYRKIKLIGSILAMKERDKDGALFSIFGAGGIQEEKPVLNLTIKEFPKFYRKRFESSLLKLNALIAEGFPFEKVVGNVISLRKLERIMDKERALLSYSSLHLSIFQKVLSRCEEYHHSIKKLTETNLSVLGSQDETVTTSYFEEGSSPEKEAFYLTNTHDSESQEGPCDFYPLYHQHEVCKNLGHSHEWLQLLSSSLPAKISPFDFF